MTMKIFEIFLFLILPALLIFLFKNKFYWYIKAIKNYTNFNGKASYDEFWHYNFFLLFSLLFLLGLCGLIRIIPLQILGAYYLFHVIPSFSVTTRRLHALNKSGWWTLLYLYPPLGSILFFWLLFFANSRSEETSKEESMSEENLLPERYVAVPAKKLSKRPISLGVALVSIFLFITGALEIFDFFLSGPPNLHIVWGCLLIVSGIGLLLQKFWAYRLTQVLLIIAMILSPVYLFSSDKYLFITKLTSVVIIIILCGIILWYLSRKNIKEQFLEPALIEKLEKRRSTS